MRLAPMLPGELIPCTFVWHDPGITPCCKSLLNISSRKIDSNREGTRNNDSKDATFRLFQISISQNPLGDFCNIIPPDVERTSCIGCFGSWLCKNARARHLLEAVQERLHARPQWSKP